MQRSPHRILAVLACTAPLAAGIVACGGSQEPPQPPPPPTVTLPTGVQWQSFQGVDVPTSDQGPEHAEGPVVSGFEHSPVGAALAAIHATIRMSVATDAQWSTVGQRMLADGPGRDAWATTRAQISITEPIEDGAPMILGYRIVGYSSQRSDVEIYSLHPDNSLSRNSARVIWRGDDWRLHIPYPPTNNPVAAVATPPNDLVLLTSR